MRVDNNESSPARFSNDVSEDNNDQQEDGGGYVTPPSSPVLTPKAPKVTPTKMKKYCLRPSNRPPQPRLHVGGNTSLMNN